jgi:hypothetical protein
MTCSYDVVVELPACVKGLVGPHWETWTTVTATVNIQHQNCSSFDIVLRASRYSINPIALRRSTRSATHHSTPHTPQRVHHVWHTTPNIQSHIAKMDFIQGTYSQSAQTTPFATATPIPNSTNRLRRPPPTPPPRLLRKPPFNLPHHRLRHRPYPHFTPLAPPKPARHATRCGLDPRAPRHIFHLAQDPRHDVPGSHLLGQPRAPPGVLGRHTGCGDVGVESRARGLCGGFAGVGGVLDGGVSKV